MQLAAVSLGKRAAPFTAQSFTVSQTIHFSSCCLTSYCIEIRVSFSNLAVNRLALADYTVFVRENWHPHFSSVMSISSKSKPWPSECTFSRRLHPGKISGGSLNWFMKMVFGRHTTPPDPFSTLFLAFSTLCLAKNSSNCFG